MAPGAAEVVNPVAAEEIPAWLRSMMTTFLNDPHGAGVERRAEIMRRSWEPERAWGVREGARWVATLRSETRGLTVPGGGTATREVAIDALTNVTVAATHRRRGLMSQMLKQSLEAARERGDALSALVAAEWPIYGRFGYAPSTLTATYALHPGRLGAAAFGDPGRVRQVEREEFATVAAEVHDAARRGRAGQIDRSQDWWNRLLGRDGYAPSQELPHNWFVHEGEAGIDGLLGWSAVGAFSLLAPRARVDVWELASASDGAYRDLWAYLTGLDGVDEVRLRLRPVDEPVRWLLRDGRALVLSEQVDLMWLRVLDVPGALAARRYSVPGELILEVVDEAAGGFASGRYRLAADGEEVECERTGRAADVVIDARALASIYLGGFGVDELRLAGGVSERTPGSLARLGTMFRTPLAPWNSTWF
jgi:predicted acetyltransferase